jgi:hypothetical protein
MVTNAKTPAFRTGGVTALLKIAGNLSHNLDKKKLSRIRDKKRKDHILLVIVRGTWILFFSCDSFFVEDELSLNGSLLFVRCILPYFFSDFMPNSKLGSAGRIQTSTFGVIGWLEDFRVHLHVDFILLPGASTPSIDIPHLLDGDGVSGIPASAIAPPPVPVFDALRTSKFNSTISNCLIMELDIPYRACLVPEYKTGDLPR